MNAKSNNMTRIGFHYFQDTQHYRENDLDTWLPELKELEAKWLVLKAPIDRAIPEHFIQGLLEAEIQPILDFDLSPDQMPPSPELFFLYNIYAKWGLKYVNLFKKPNIRSSWESTNWAQTDLAERFLDIFLPQAEGCLHRRLTPIFPPLEPGGDYWDTAFLRTALQGIQRRGFQRLLDQMVIGVTARVAGKPLNWGTGGPERWPGVMPYLTPENEEDQRGFRIFDWYNAFIQAVLVKPSPIFLFETGASYWDDAQPEKYVQTQLSIAQLLTGDPVDGLEQIPANVIGAAFWQLAAPQGGLFGSQAWFNQSGEPGSIVAAFKNLGKSETAVTPKTKTHVIDHYLLLPSYDGQISDVQFDIIRPFVKKHKPTIGFSIHEAQQAQRVTVIGGPGTYPDEEISKLRTAGCIVHELEDNGIDIASF